MGRIARVRITKKVADRKATSPDEYIWDAQQVGLGLRVLGSGRRTWVYRYRLGRRQTIAKLGTYKHGHASDVDMPIARAREVARAWRASLDKGLDPRQAMQRTGDTVADYWGAFVEHKRDHENLSPTTLRGYDSLWTAHISNPKYGISTLAARAVSRRDVIRLRKQVAKLGRAKAAARLDAAIQADDGDKIRALERRLPTAGNGAANKLVLVISSFFSWLVEEEEVEESPCTNIRKLPTAGRDGDNVLHRDDALEAIDLIRQHARNPGHRDILLLLIFTAQRSSDIRLRRWDDLVLDDPSVPLPYLRIDRHKSRRRTGAAKKVPLSPQALDIVLRRWPEANASVGRTKKGWQVRVGRRRVPLLPISDWAGLLPPASGPMFPGDDPRKPLTDVYHQWKDISANSSRPRVRASDVHGLRHAAATLIMATTDADRELIQRVLDHAPGADVTDRYLHDTYDVMVRLGDILMGADS